MSNPQDEAKKIQEFLNNPQNFDSSNAISSESTDLTDMEFTIKFEDTNELLESDDTEAARETSGDGQEDIKPIPGPLRMVQFQQVLIAAGLAIASIAAAIALKQVKFLSIMILSIYFVAMAAMLEWDWRKGKISQRVVACTHVITRTRTTQVICRDTQYVYNYFLPDKRSGFVEGYTYIVWTRNSNPKAVLAYQPL